MKRIVHSYLCITLLLGVGTAHAGESTVQRATQRFLQWQQQPQVRQIARQLVIGAAVAGLLYGSYKVYQGLRGGLAGPASLTGQPLVAPAALLQSEIAAQAQRTVEEKRAREEEGSPTSEEPLSPTFEPFEQGFKAPPSVSVSDINIRELARIRTLRAEERNLLIQEAPSGRLNISIPVSPSVIHLGPPSPIEGKREVAVREEEKKGAEEKRAQEEEGEWEEGAVLVPSAAQIAQLSRTDLEHRGYQLTLNKPTEFITQYHDLMTDIQHRIRQLSSTQASATGQRQDEMRIDIDHYNKLKNALLAEFSKGPWMLGHLIAASNFTAPPTQRDASAVVWYLYSLAVQHGHPFIDGTFNIEDNGYLYNFLKKVPGVYERAITLPVRGKILLSSHYSYIKEQFGIDIEGHEYTLPNDKHHILFGQGVKKAQGQQMVADPHRMFLKPEDHGLGDWYSFLQHTAGYAQSWYRWFNAANEAMGYKKERPPADMLSLWNSLVETVYPGEISSLSRWFKSLEHPLISNAKRYGIAFIYVTLDQVAQDAAKNNIDIAKIVGPLKEMLSKHQHHTVRQGQEVIINHDMLMNIKEWQAYWIGQFQQ